MGPMHADFWMLHFQSILSKYIGIRFKIQTIFEKNIKNLVIFKVEFWGLPGGSVVKNLPANAGDVSSIPDPTSLMTQNI